jgi:hypothetical protein
MREKGKDSGYGFDVTWRQFVLCTADVRDGNSVGRQPMVEGLN